MCACQTKTSLSLSGAKQLTSGRFIPRLYLYLTLTQMCVVPVGHTDVLKNDLASGWTCNDPSLQSLFLYVTSHLVQERTLTHLTVHMPDVLSVYSAVILKFLQASDTFMHLVSCICKHIYDVTSLTFTFLSGLMNLERDGWGNTE